MLKGTSPFTAVLCLQLHVKLESFLHVNSGQAEPAAGLLRACIDV